MIRFNKKASTIFPYIISVAMIILFLAFIFVLSIHKDSYFDKDFYILKSVDKSNSISFYEEIFLNSFVLNYASKSIDDFIDNQLYGIERNLDNLDRENFIGCLYDEAKTPIFYNQKLIDETKTDDNDGVSCLSDGEEFNNNFAIYLKEKLEEKIEGFFSSSDDLDFNSIYVSSVSQAEFLINISSRQLYSDDVGSVSRDNVYEFDFILGSYSELFNVINHVLPELSDSVKSEIPVCRRGDDIPDNVINKVEYCIDKIFKELINKKSSRILSEFDVSVKELLNIPIEGYDVFMVSFDSKEDNLDLKFMIVLDEAPYDVVEYSLNNLEVLDNAIRIRISKFATQDVSNRFIVLYSYEDFFNPAVYGSERYNKLKDLLVNSAIPSTLHDTSIVVDGIRYYHSNEDSDLNLNLLLVDGEDGFGPDGIKSKIVYQIYDFDSKNYVLFEEGREVYFAVFAVDHPNYNYFTDENLLELSYNSIIPQKVFGPRSLRTDEVSIINNLPDMESSFVIDINDISDDEIYSYGLYVYMRGDDDVELEKGVCNADFCYRGLSKTDTNVLVTSDISNVNNPNYGKVVFLGPEFVLENSKNYNVVLVTEDEQGRGTVVETFKEYDISQSSTSDTNYYVLNREDGILIRPYKDVIEIKDNKPPDINSVVFESYSLNRAEDDFFIQWKSMESEDINSLYTLTYVHRRGLSSPDEMISEVGIDGKIENLQYSPDITLIEVRKVSPVDSSRNSKYPRININSAPDLSSFITWSG